MKHDQGAIGEGKELSSLLPCVLSHTQIPDSSQSSLSCLYSLTIY